ncbi:MULTISPECIES: ABC transporter permease [Gordonibacter]|uniref:FtsX-like permease family protein n=1 Tax=Gordonibacter faecis TaxID=3047475 RepID=A0ABT7DMI6_9ACTN|nr:MULTISPECIES: FtsX-like permease family protein [unclassified Gordonibacter]MDJ1650602.1 FtsX-like permease family protein [Gordonibacter sp. KGMB12511]HIW75770.1 FtsX-like permease family protein [Candidatus Gordonibacter avicola]
MRSAFNKEVARSITHSLGRFLAIAAIVALGTGFYAGLRMTAPDMKLAADAFYDGTKLMDVRVLSTLGLTDDDLAALRDVEGVDAVMGAYETDVMATIAGEQYATRVHSLPDAARTSDTSDGVQAHADDPDYLNRPILVEGAWPARAGECVLSADLVTAQNARVGDTVRIDEWTEGQEDALAAREYTVVGLVSASYYATSSDLGATSLGSGSITQYMYVPEDDFSADLPYTEAFLTVAGAADERSGSAAYDERVAGVTERIEALAPFREKARVDGLRAEAQGELDDARAEYDEQKADADSQLADAKQQLDDAAASIAENEQKFADAQVQYDNGVAELANQRASGQWQLDAAAQQVADGRAQVDAARPAIEQGQAQLAVGWAQWRQGADALAQARAAWQAQSDALSGAVAQMEQGIAALEAQIQALDPNDPAYAATKAALEAQREGLAAQLEQFKQEHAADFAALDAAKQQLDAQQATVDATKQELDTQQVAFDQQKAQFDAVVAQVEQGAADLAAAQALADSQLAAAQQQLDSAAAQLTSGRAQLAQGKADYESGLAEYESKKAEADEKLADAKRQLDDAQRQIDDLENPVWYVMDRTANYGVASFNADADRVDSIAAVFPFIFFLVAALVALTTMTRMVEEERMLIGTYKALGYSRARITAKYLVYASIASVTGSIIGIAVLSQVLPTVIMKAYGIIYFVPSQPLPLTIDLGLAGLAAGLGVGVTLVATAAAAVSTLRERPATLMLPRAPKSGKRILLERITPLWRHLSFSWKVTFRNLFRYKKRFIMTVIGIAGCTALLLTGLGLSDAINDIIDNQFGSITKYNALITLEDELTAEEQAELDAVLGNKELVSDHGRVQRENMLTAGPDDEDVGVQVMVPKDADSLDRFVMMRTRLGHEPITLGADGVVLAEKLATQLGVGVGDTVSFTEQDAIGNATGSPHEAMVTGIMENYIYNYAFIGPERYEELMGEAPPYSTELAIVAPDPHLRSQLSEDLGAVEGVKTVAYNDETIDAYRDMLSSVNMIVVVLVVAAAALAFIVLYNLTNINITERMREIATLKVLGFTPREVDAYIYREIALLSIIGSLVGLVLGVWMESFVVVTAEVDQVMFGRVIHPESFLLAFVLTMVFTVLVMIAMRRKLGNVDMVESLKSNE